MYVSIYYMFHFSHTTDILRCPLWQLQDVNFSIAISPCQYNNTRNRILRLIIISDNVFGLKTNFYVFCKFLPCNSRRQLKLIYRKKLRPLSDSSCLNISFLSYWQGEIAM